VSTFVDREVSRGQRGGIYVYIYMDISQINNILHFHLVRSS
jgi:hypothetical protein